MKQAKGNPDTNRLPNGLKEELLREGVERSGYPLQGIAAHILSCHLNVTEEWSYIDRETQEQRALDLFCYKQLAPQEKDRRIIPALILLVECKRSDLPYIFFKAAVEHRWPDIPKVLGLPYTDLEISRANQVHRITPVECLQLKTLSFFADSPPPLCSSFSKAARTGSTLTLTGSDAFNRVVMPLVSAFEHASKYYKPDHDGALYFADLTVCICVLDAPLVLAEGGPKQTKLIMVPWVRVIRREVTLPKSRGERRERTFGIEVVHRDFLETFLKEHISGLASSFAERALALEQVLHAGKGTLPSQGEWNWRDLVLR